MFLKFSLSVISLCRYLNLVLMDATYKTCKLALPLFFLVVRMNVGYSSCRIYNSTWGHHIHYRSTNDSAQEVGRMWYWSGELHDRLPTVGRECNTCSFPRQCCVSVRVPPTSGMAPLAPQHQKRSQQLSNVLYGTSESAGRREDGRWVHQSIDGPAKVTCVVTVPVRGVSVRTETLPVMWPVMHAGTETVPWWTEWHSGVKTSPCPKLRLRAVNIIYLSFPLHNHYACTKARLRLTTDRVPSGIYTWGSMCVVSPIIHNKIMIQFWNKWNHFCQYHPHTLKIKDYFDFATTVLHLAWWLHLGSN